MAKIKKKTKVRKKLKVVERSLPFTRENYSIFAIGILIIILGYIALSIGPFNSFSSLSVAPILLVIGYCVIIPIAILYRSKADDSEEAGKS